MNNVVTVKEAVNFVRNGKPIIMVDDEDRENEGDIVIPTAVAKIEHIALMLKEARGLICVSIPVSVGERLQLPAQVAHNTSHFSTPFAVSIDHVSVSGFGATARGRFLTMQRLIAKDALLQEFTSPGEVMPLLAHPCGVIGRVGQTEGSHDLARLAGFFPSGIICEILNEKGALIRGSELAHFSDIHDMPIISVAAIRDYRLHHEAWAREIGSSEVETKYGKFKVVSFFDDVTERTHLAFLAGESLGDKVPLVRIHSECVTGDIFGSKRCDCGLQFESALRMLAKSRDNGGGGALIYLRQEGRGIGLSAKLESYNLQDSGLDTVEANVALGFSEDGRDYRIGGAILNALGLVKIRLLTNNPSKIAALESCGITITERVPLIVPVEESAKRYLQTKKEKLGHLI